MGTWGIEPCFAAAIRSCRQYQKQLCTVHQIPFCALFGSALNTVFFSFFHSSAKNANFKWLIGTQGIEPRLAAAPIA
jgi:hypothetical protein